MCGSNKLIHDHATKSLWSTFAGEPAVGPLVGRGIAHKDEVLALRFREAPGEESGGEWTLEEGALLGPTGAHLERPPAHRAFWFGWYAQYPETRLVRR